MNTLAPALVVHWQSTTSCQAGNEQARDGFVRRIPLFEVNACEVLPHYTRPAVLLHVGTGKAVPMKNLS